MAEPSPTLPRNRGHGWTFATSLFASRFIAQSLPEPWSNNVRIRTILHGAAFSAFVVSGAHAAAAASPPTFFDLLFSPQGRQTTNATAERTPPGAPAKRQLVRASWYGGGERLAARTSTGEPFRPMGHTAAHRTLPFGTMLRVTSAASGRSTIVRINDRGPAIASGRSLDLSRGAALDIGLVASGSGAVYIEEMR